MPRCAARPTRHGRGLREVLGEACQGGRWDADTRRSGADRSKAREKGSNDEWKRPHDPDAKITKMKDGRTHLAHKAEHAIDLETGAIVGATVPSADQGDTTTIQQTLPGAAEQLEPVAAVTDHTVKVVEEVVADTGLAVKPLRSKCAW